MVYKDENTTPTDTGVTITTNFAGHNGLNNLTINTATNSSFFTAGSFYEEILVSGNVDGVQVSGTQVARFSLDADSALKPTTNITTYTANNTVGSGLNKIFANIYYANVKYLKDMVNLTDEFTAAWYRNGGLITSGELSSPRISVYNTTDGSNIQQNQAMYFASQQHGVARYNMSTVLVSGEPYHIVVSGIIDGAYRTWAHEAGLDYL